MTLLDFMRDNTVTAFFVLFSCLIQGQNPGRSADAVLVHARIYTVSGRQPWAEALAIRDGKTLAVGTENEIRRYRSASTKVIDAKGRLVLPSFTDCHAHFLDGSFTRQQVNLDDATTISEITRRVKAY